jgi:hypothetical protein
MTIAARYASRGEDSVTVVLPSYLSFDRPTFPEPDEVPLAESSLCQNVVGVLAQPGWRPSER